MLNTNPNKLVRETLAQPGCVLRNSGSGHVNSSTRTNCSACTHASGVQITSYLTVATSTSTRLSSRVATCEKRSSVSANSTVVVRALGRLLRRNSSASRGNQERLRPGQSTAPASGIYTICLCDCFSRLPDADRGNSESDGRPISCSVE